MAEGNGQAYAADIKDIGDRIANLTLVKAVELKNYLKDVYHIEPAAGGVMIAPTGGGGGGTAVAEPAAVQTEFSVILEDFDPAKKINVIKVVREITGLGLKEAKDLVEAKGKAVKENIPKEDAEKIKKQLEDGGAKASLK